jgi:uncharacterized protein YdaU (DUF1376 family)
MANAWSAFYWRDYIADTGHLSLAEHGAYLLLMAHYYATGNPLPANASVLHRVCRCTTDADRAATDQILQQFFVLDGNVYRHHRIDRELAKAAEKTECRRAAANARHSKTDANAHAKAHANEMHLHTQPQPQPQPQDTSTSTSTSTEHSEHSGGEPKPRGNGKKPSAPPAGEAADTRHVPTRELIKQQHLERFGSHCCWDGREGKTLKAFLDSNPLAAQEQIAEMVHARFASEGINGARPREWLPNLTKYAGGPLDRFGKVQVIGGNGNGNHKREGFHEQNVDEIRELLDERQTRRLASEMDGHAAGSVPANRAENEGGA